MKLHRPIVDYYQFRVPVPPLTGRAGPEVNLRKTLETVLTQTQTDAIMSGDMERSSGGKLRFENRFLFKASFAEIYAGKQPFIIVRLPGQACAKLTELGHLLNIMNNTADTCSRIDLAVDIKDGGSPEDILKKRSKKKEYARYPSRTGETCYIGARTSARYVRVYRFNEPHPRHEYTRIEVELKDNRAVPTALAVAQSGVASVLQSELEWQGWDSPAFQLSDRATPVLVSHRGSRSDAGTRLWLEMQVAPAIKRLIDEGVLTPIEVLSILLPPSSQR